MVTHRIQVIDSHTGGEPTRVVIAGGPDLGMGDLAARRDRFRDAFDEFRSAIVNEPRGNDAMVGALLVPPVDPASAAGVIFFNNVGYLGMCVHGTIGLMVTLAHLGRIGPGRYRLETPVGSVTAQLEADGMVRVTNVPSYRTEKAIRVQVAGLGEVTGDVAWAGNWFFLTDCGSLELKLAEVEALTDRAWRIRQALVQAGIRGRDGGEIDHVELFGPPRGNADSRNFVLCPGKAYDRSPCGTGTSAKLACLAADGKLAPGERWRQESILGSIFEGTYQREGDLILPTISGTAFVNAETTLILGEADPFCMGIRG